MLKKVVRKRLMLAGTLALSVSLLAPVGAKANDYGCYEDCSITQVHITHQDMTLIDHEEYWSKITTDLVIDGETKLEVEGLVRALSKNDQFLMFNSITNHGTKNDASVSGDVLSGALGNIGANVVAGDFNAQSNVVAIAVGEQEASLVESKTFSVQKTMVNYVENYGTTNTAEASDNVLSSAMGNIGLNIAAGVNNAQTNQLAVAVGYSKVGMAVAYVQQESMHNYVNNQPIAVEGEEGSETPIELEITLEGTAHGKYEGKEKGVIYVPVDGEFIENNYKGDTWGDINIEKIELTGTITGSIPGGSIANIYTTNTASLSGSVLAYAVGNIGVNVAAGSNNLQANTLSVSCTFGISVPTPPTPPIP